MGGTPVPPGVNSNATNRASVQMCRAGMGSPWLTGDDWDSVAKPWLWLLSHWMSRLEESSENTGFLGDAKEKTENVALLFFAIDEDSEKIENNDISRTSKQLNVLWGKKITMCRGKMSHLPPSLVPGEMQSPRMVGRKRGRPPLQPAPIKVAVHNLYSAPAGALPVVKISKKRGRKPGHKLKSRVLMTPLAVSPPRSTPEPDISSIPQDAATIPNSATPQALTVCIYVNKQANLGPYLDRKKVQQLPEHFGPERPSAALQQAVQACIDCALQQKAVFSLIKQGYGGEMVSVAAFFEGKQHLLSLLVVNSIGYVLRFLKKLCRSLLCDNLFSNQPFQQYNTMPESPEVYENRRMEAVLATGSYGKSRGEGEEFHHQQLGKRNTSPPVTENEAANGGLGKTETATPEDYLVDPANMKRYPMDPADSAFGCMGSAYTMLQSPKDGHPAGVSSSSCSHRPAQVSSGGSSSTGLRHQTSSPTRNGTYLEGNRSASSPSPERQDVARPSSKNPLTWTVDDVIWFVKDADPHALGPHVELFRKHEIDGNALLLLKSDMIMKYLGLKLGPALKLCYHIEKLKQAKF
ncbi:Scml4 [Columba livia]|nr:Scml4 [Columba livia]